VKRNEEVDVSGNSIAIKQIEKISLIFGKYFDGSKCNLSLT
jgi:hypothetical protein